jgi:N-acetylglucosamine malate deacetylase 2
MDQLFVRLQTLSHATHCDGILTHAFEAGHPDHDVCAFMASALAISHGWPVWEMPLYHLSPDGNWRFQTFKEQVSAEWALQLTEVERSHKQRTLACYQSQAAVVELCDVREERFRRQWLHDFTGLSASSSNRFAVSEIEMRDFYHHVRRFCSI